MSLVFTGGRRAPSECLVYVYGSFTDFSDFLLCASLVLKLMWFMQSEFQGQEKWISLCFSLNLCMFKTSKYMVVIIINIIRAEYILGMSYGQ